MAETMPTSGTAQMIPLYRSKEEFQQSVLKDGWAAEWRMYQKLSELPAPCVVIHSYPYVCRKGSVKVKGEADFIVLCPRGVLVFEVKSAPLLFDPVRGWHTKNRPDRRRSDPIEQAEDELDAVVKFLRGTLGDSGQEIIWRREVLCECAVAFPNSVFEGGVQLAGNRSSRLFLGADVLSRSSAKDIVESLFQHRREFQASSSELRCLSEREIARAVEKLLPEIESRPCAGPSLADEKEAITDNTRFGLQMLPQFGDRNVFGTWSIQSGVAGSGKTLLAIHWAREASLSGRRVLFLCYNRTLASHLTQNPANRTFEIFTFHGLSESRSHAAGLDWTPPKPGNDDELRYFYEKTSPALLSEASKLLSERQKADGSGKLPQLYDVIVVDEAQDIRRHWWPAILSQLRDSPDSELHILWDSEQQLYGRDAGIPDELRSRLKEAPPLTINLRNGQKIARFIGRLSSNRILPAHASPMGYAPVIEPPSDSASELCHQLENRLSALLAEGVSLAQMAVLCDHTRTHPEHVLHGMESILNTQILGLGGHTPNPDRTLENWRDGRGLLVTTARSFKGLEADVVILLGMRNFSRWFTAADLYVASTRARCRLYAICRPGEVVRRLSEALIEAPGPLTSGGTCNV